MMYAMTPSLQFDQQRREIDKSLNSGTAHSRMARGACFPERYITKKHPLKNEFRSLMTCHPVKSILKRSS
jgi:hypothetical protein